MLLLAEHANLLTSLPTVEEVRLREHLALGH